MPKYEVKKDSGRKTMVTDVKTNMALFWLSAVMASSFCSMERSWKSCGYVLVEWSVQMEWGLTHCVQRLFQVGDQLLVYLLCVAYFSLSKRYPIQGRLPIWVAGETGAL